MYPGGKAGEGVYQRIINEIPPHRVYLEPFLGGGSIALAKKPAEITFVVDLLPEALAMFELRRSRIAGFGQVIAEQRDAIEFLRSYPYTGDEFVYCDPPYLMESRRSPRKRYKFESSFALHRSLLEWAAGAGVPIAISAYKNNLYDDTLRGWRQVSYTGLTRGSGSRVETLYCNYARPLRLHDYRYLGENWKERQRIKKKIRRWRARLEAMPTLERQAMLAAISEAEFVFARLETSEGTSRLPPA